MSAVLSARESRVAMSHSDLSRRAKVAFPRHYIADDAHRRDMESLSKDKALDFLMAMSRAHQDGINLTGEDIAASINAAAPDDCRVVSESDFLEMRQHAIALWKLLSTIRSAMAEKYTCSQIDKVSDAIRDAERFDREYRIAAMEMPEIVENAEL